MKKLIFIVIVALCLFTFVNGFAQGISRKVIATAGGTLTGGGNQIDYTIGETAIATLSAGENQITQGFEQPNPQTSGGIVLCYGAKVSDLTPSGTNIKWYGSATAATALATTALLSTKTYYYTETIDNVVSARIPVEVVITPTSIAGSVSGASGIICFNTGKTLTLSTNHRGAVQWQSASMVSGTAGTFIDIVGQTGNTLQTGNLTATTYFRAVVTNGVCSSKNTYPAKVTVRPQSIAGTITGGGATVCPGINSTKLTLNGYVGTIQWHSSADNINFTPISTNGTYATYNAKNLTTTTYYRAEVAKGLGCTPAVSAAVAVNVKPAISAGTISGVAVIPANTSTELTLSNYEAGASLQWKYSRYPNGPYYIRIAPISTGPVYNTVNVTGGVYYRVDVSSGGCTVKTDPYYVYAGSTAKPGEIIKEDRITRFDAKPYPNPFNDAFWIDLTTESSEPVKISVYDMLGKRLEQFESMQSDIPLRRIGEHYASGVYNIIVNQGEEVKMLRVVKQ